MGVIIKRLLVAGDKASREAETVFDSGSRASLVRAELAWELATPLHRASPRTFRLADGKGQIVVQESTVLDIRIDGKELDGEFYLVPGLPREVVIGADFMQKWDVALFPKPEEVVVRVDPDAIELL